MGYQPFLIAPFRTGLDSDQEPWLLPQDAFTEIENGHIHHGYVEKRQGYRTLAQMVHGREITAASNANPAVFTVADATGISDGDSVILYSLSGGTWSSLNSAEYTVDGLAGATFNLLDSGGTAVDGTGLGAYAANSGRLATFENLRMMGIFRFISSDNSRDLLVSDTERIALYNSSNRLFQPLDLVDPAGVVYTDDDVWDSADPDSDINYVWSANWQAAGLVNRVYFTNGQAFDGGTPGTGGILYYDGQSSEVTQFQPILSAAGAATIRTLYGCKLIFSIKQRLVCLHTFEDDNGSLSTFPQRARWCAAQNPTPTVSGGWTDTIAGGGGFVDAPTGDQIISAQALQNQIIVHFTNSVWSLRVVSDPSLPFRWEKINNLRACDGKMATVGYDRYSLAAGQRGLTATDGVETRRVDERIEDFTSSEINQDEFGKVFGERDFQARRSWLLFPAIESEDSQSALIYDDESGAFSEYKFSREVSGAVVDMNVLGHGTAAIDFTFQDFVAANDLDWAFEDADEETFLSFFWGQNSELFLGGDRNGFVFIMNTGNEDAGNDISFSLKSAGWNPFQKEGLECQFGYIDFYLDSDQNTDMSISFFKNDNEDPYGTEPPYVTRELDLLPDLSYISSVVDIVPNSDPTTGFVISSPSNGLSAGDQFYMYGVKDAFQYNDRLFEADSVTENAISIAEDITSIGFAITGITQANPGVVTSVAHGFSDGDEIYIVDVGGMVEVNGFTFTVANSTTDTFELSGVDTTGFTLYTAGGYAFSSYLTGGQIVERKFYRTKVWKRAYAGGIGYLHSMSLTSTGSDEPLRIHAFKPWFKPVGRRILG
jgi:hypothetical protein